MFRYHLTGELIRKNPEGQQKSRMQNTQIGNALDLEKSYPRSPNERLGGYIIMPRIIDKCRAVIAGSNGEYNYNCPLDQRFFNFTGIDAEAFKDQVAMGKSDEELLEWVNEHAVPHTEDELNIWAYTTRWSIPSEPQMIAYFESARLKVAPHKHYINTWFQLLDAEEGRF